MAMNVQAPDVRAWSTTSVSSVGRKGFFMTEGLDTPQGPRFTRRRLLGGGAALGGAALAGSALPIHVRKALAAPMPRGRGSLQNVEHVVLLMQENRSFDHYFGTFSGVR